VSTQEPWVRLLIGETPIKQLGPVHSPLVWSWPVERRSFGTINWPSIDSYSIYLRTIITLMISEIFGSLLVARGDRAGTSRQVNIYLSFRKRCSLTRSLPKTDGSANPFDLLSPAGVWLRHSGESPSCHCLPFRLRHSMAMTRSRHHYLIYISRCFFCPSLLLLDRMIYTTTLCVVLA
jgi:hypothetical protein